MCSVLMLSQLKSPDLCSRKISDTKVSISYVTGRPEFPVCLSGVAKGIILALAEDIFEVNDVAIEEIGDTKGVKEFIVSWSEVMLLTFQLQ